MNNKVTQDTFLKLGQEWDLSPELRNKLEAFTCVLYALKASITIINKLRYHLFCAKKGEIESHQLPPCRIAWGNTHWELTIRLVFGEDVYKRTHKYQALLAKDGRWRQSRKVNSWCCTGWKASTWSCPGSTRLQLHKKMFTPTMYVSCKWPQVHRCVKTRQPA